MLQLAEQFATDLNNTRFEEASELLAPECEYHYWEGNYVGNRNIASLYRINHEQSFKLFDEVVYSSEVEQLSANTFRLKFTDRIRIGEAWHRHRFDNIVRIENDRIVDIEHRDLLGTRDAYLQFFEKNKV